MPAPVPSMLVHADAPAYGMVFDPDSVRAPGVPGYMDGGSSPLVRLTTDSTNFFRAPLATSAYRRSRVLICVPGSKPLLAMPVEHFEKLASLSLAIVAEYWLVGRDTAP